jgi:capsular exopolysaccharide synthesis family protein
LQEFASTISPYLRTLRRKAFLVISFTSLTTLAALLLSLKDPNTYVSSFRILLEPTNSTARLSQASTLTRTEGLPDEDLLNLDYPTQLEVLKSSLILSKIAQEVKTKLPGVKVSFINEELREKLTVERVTTGPSIHDGTKIFEVTYEGINPQIVQTVADATANQYLQYSLEERQNSLNAGVKFIDERLPELEQRVADLQDRQQELQQHYSLIDPSEKGQELFAQIDDLGKQKLANESELLELENLASTLEQQLNLTPKQAVAALALNQNPNHRELLRELQEIEGEIAAESARFTAQSPNLLTLKEDKNHLLALLQQKRQPILKQHSISVADDVLALNYQNESFLELTQKLVDTHNQIKVLQVRDRSLQTSKQSLEKPAQQLPAIARQYKELEQQLALTTRILDQLLTQRETLLVESTQKDVPWKLLSKVDLLRDADDQPLVFPPNRIKKLALGIMVGMTLGMSTALLLEKWRNIFYTAEDIQDLLLLPLLGEIPVDDRFQALPNTNPGYSALALVETHNNRQKSLFLRSFDSLYAELTFLYADNPVSSLVVSSVEPKDGQSTVALQLAKTAAAEGKRVLLVDANLEKPSLSTQLKSPQSKRLSNVFGNTSTREEVIYQVPEVDNLYILTADVLQDRASTRLGSTKMQHLMEDLSVDYDLIIYDSPHFLDSPDVSFLTAQTDGIVMVVGVNKTRQSLVKEAVNQINAFRLPTLGIVANHLN